MASELHDDFDNIGWAISVENNDESDESIHFIKFDTDINPNYRPISSALRSNQYSIQGLCFIFCITFFML